MSPEAFSPLPEATRERYAETPGLITFPGYPLKINDNEGRPEAYQVDVALKVERHYRRPQDIEWAFDRATGRLLLLQSRPETVWAQKDAEAAPVATAQADPLAHVMAIFGGRK